MINNSFRIRATALGVIFTSLAACARRDAAVTDSAAAAPASAVGAASSSTMPTDVTPVRGAIATMSDSVLVVTTKSGDVRILVNAPLHVYQRANATLSDVTAKSFVGVTSVKQADGSQVATEIHIFPEELRGTGEGSYLMTAPAGAHDSSRSTMTNGTVASPATSEAPRMTNGAVASKAGETLTVDYHGGSQSIKVPSGVKVTTLAPSAARLASGDKVVVLAKKEADGSMKASSVVLASEPSK